MQPLRSIAVFCGSSPGADPAIVEATRRFGRSLAAAGITLIYGGGSGGLMGLAADAALAGGGRVVGIIPGHLHHREVQHRHLTELLVVDSMHTRKRLMFDRADAFVSLPGGLGTLDETIEMITWRQLGLHDKPIVLVDQAGYWQPLLGLFEHIIGAGFARPDSRALWQVVPTVDAVLPALAQAPEPAIAANPDGL